MANELVAILNKRNQSGIGNLSMVVISLEGDIAATVPLVEVGNEAIYRADMPGTVPAGCYSLRTQRDNNDQLMASGEICWNGSAAVTAAELNYQQNTLPAINSILAAQLTNLQSVIDRIDLGVTTTTIDKNQLVTMIQAAFLNDNDGQALLSAIAANVEAAFNDETDGSPTLAGIGGVVSAQLVAYGTATAANVTASQAAIIAALPPAPTATGAQQTAILAAIGGLVSGLTPAQQNQLSDIQLLLRADEVRDRTVSPETVTKFEAGTTNVLLNKNVGITENADGCPERIEVLEP